MLLLTGVLRPLGAAGGLRSPGGLGGWGGGVSGEPQALAGLPKGWCLCAKGALVFVRSCPSPPSRMGREGCSPSLFFFWNVLLEV